MKMTKKAHKCPVCGKFEFPYVGSFDVCEVCGWEDDDFQERHPDEEGGANRLSMNEYRAKFNSGWRPDWAD